MNATTHDVPDEIPDELQAAAKRIGSRLDPALFLQDPERAIRKAIEEDNERIRALADDEDVTDALAEALFEHFNAEA